MASKSKGKGRRGLGAELKGFRLINVSCRVGELQSGEMPTKGTQQVQAAINALDEKNRSAVIVVTFQFTLVYSEPEGIGPPALRISAQYVLHYAFSGKPTPQNVQASFQQAGIAKIWPYWLELAQSLCVRVGFPAFPLPGPGAGQVQKDSVRTRRGRKLQKK
jgi:hypothetical protein